MSLFFRREELLAARLSILLERRCKLDRILRNLLQVHLVVFNGSVGGKLRLTVLDLKAEKYTLTHFPAFKG